MPSKKEIYSNKAFIAFIAPVIIGLIVFYAIPIIWGIVISFSDAKGVMTPKAYVGFKNYIDLFTDENFMESLVTIIIFAALIIPLTIVTSLFLAVMVRSMGKYQGIFRSIFFMPVACSYVIAALIWKMSLFNGLRFGVVNSILTTLGFSSVQWLNTLPQVWVPLITVRLWLQVGLYMILFIVGMEEIPESLLEVAEIDGLRRNSFGTFRRIIFPMLRNTTLFVLFINIINAFTAFDEFYNLLADASTERFYLARVPLVYIYQMSMSAQNFSLASAGYVIIFLMILMVTFLQSRITGLGQSIEG